MNGATGAQGTQSSCIAPSDWRWVGVNVTGRQQPSSWGRHRVGVCRGFLNRVELRWLISVILVNVKKMWKIRHSGFLPTTPFFCPLLSLPLLPVFACDNLCTFHHSWYLVGNVHKLTFLRGFCLLHYLLWWPSKHADELPRFTSLLWCVCRQEWTNRCIVYYYIILIY